MDRESEIQKLCEGVLNIALERWYNPNGADESTCPLCSSTSYDINASISEIDHDVNCAYLIAKSLSTK